jgi:hypothetical protein
MMMSKLSLMCRAIPFGVSFLVQRLKHVGSERQSPSASGAPAIAA